MKSLAEKHKPRTFKSVIGQEPAVEWLARQVRTGIGKNVILHGPSGIGKNSLARIYAQALLCPNSCDSGSPCRTCKQCVDFEQPGGHPSYTELNCARFGRFEDIEEELKNLKFHPMFGRWRILVLDEAQQMSPKALDALLKQLEETPPWVVFVILTTAFDKLPQTVTSRCVVHELKPVRFETSLLLLKQICEAENIQYEAEGLALIAQVSQGNVRDMINRLDQISEGGGYVAEQEVRKLFNLNYVDRIVRYLRALLAADLQAQLDVIEEWPDHASKKAEALQACLVFLFTTEFLRLYRPDRLLSSILPEDREWIAAKMLERAKTAGIDAREFWQEVVDFWNANEAGMTDAALCAKITRFDAFMNVERTPDVTVRAAICENRRHG